MSVREDLHRLVDRLPEAEEQAARRFLEFLVTQGEYDEEPLTPEEAKEAEEGWQAYKRGEFVTLEELRRERGRE